MVPLSGVGGAIRNSVHPQARLGKTLYRQIIRWCDRTGQVPFDPIPPVTLIPPLVNQTVLQQVANEWTFRRIESSTPNLNINPAETSRLHANGVILDYLPRESLVEQKKMVLPIRNASSLRGIVRAVFRMNRLGEFPEYDTECKEDVKGFGDNNDEAVKKRIQLAFEAMKSLNDLSAMLEERELEREAHWDNAGVQFFVGQVVQHKKERWRGVITGWKRSPNKGPKGGDPGKYSGESQSVEYKIEYKDVPVDDIDQEDDIIQYAVIVDVGDSHLEQHRLQASIPQSDLDVLSLANAKRLSRIRNGSLKHYFDKYDMSTCCFVPNERLAYEYPSDMQRHRDFTGLTATADMDALNPLIVDSVKCICTHLEKTIKKNLLTDSSAMQLETINSIEKSLSRIIRDAPPHTFSCQSPWSAIHYLTSLGNITHEISETMLTRRRALESMKDVKFRLGDIVKHKKYGFRGVIISWDPKPRVDVSQWDGLQHLEDVENLPFYAIVPDRQDCVNAFGAPRPFRYVCQDNLEICLQNESIVNVDHSSDWPDWFLDTSSFKYVAPNEIKFKHGEGIGSEEVSIEKCMEALQREISSFQVAVQSDTLSKSTLPSVATNFSMENLLCLLKNAERWEDAIVVEETIKDIWQAHEDQTYRDRLDDARHNFSVGKKETALSELTDLVKDSPFYFEAWNKKATCHFLQGEMTLAIESTKKTLQLEPRHFRAWSGFGIMSQEDSCKLDIDHFRKCLDLNPWSPVASKLSSRLDHYDSEMEEEGALEGSAPHEN